MFEVYMIWHDTKQPNVTRWFAGRFPTLEAARAFALKQPFSSVIEGTDR